MGAVFLAEAAAVVGEVSAPRTTTQLTKTQVRNAKRRVKKQQMQLTVHALIALHVH